MNPILGTLLHAIGGLAAASFYIPYGRVRHWPWEVYWLVGGIFAWLIVPVFLTLLTIPDALRVLLELEPSHWLWPFGFGILWGIGGLTFGLSLRFLGLGLGMALSLGLTAVFGTLVPPLFDGKLLDMLNKTGGLVTLAGVLISVLGIVIVGIAGINKDKELTVINQLGIREFNIKKGMLVAAIAGAMSACFAFGIASGDEIVRLSQSSGTPELFVNSLLFAIIMLGGLTSNSIYCGFKIISNRNSRGDKVPMRVHTINLFFCALAGSIWYAQFLFYGMGSTQMGQYDFIGWSLHMSFIIIFSNIWGLSLGEWKGISLPVVRTLWMGLLVLVISTVVIGTAQLI